MKSKMSRSLNNGNPSKMLARNRLAKTNSRGLKKTFLMTNQSTKLRKVIELIRPKKMVQFTNKSKTQRSKRWWWHLTKSCRHWSVSKSSKCVTKMSSTHEASSQSRKTEITMTITKAQTFRTWKQTAFFSTVITIKATSTCLVTTEIPNRHRTLDQFVTEKTR